MARCKREDVCDRTRRSIVEQSGMVSVYKRQGGAHLQAFDDAGDLSIHCTAHLLALVVRDCIDVQELVKRGIDIVRRIVSVIVHDCISNCP